MSLYVIAEMPFTEQGAKNFIEWTKTDDGYAITRGFAGFERWKSAKIKKPDCRV
jgi:hypothetical protein